MPLPAALDILKKDLSFDLTEGNADLKLYVGEENFPEQTVTNDVTELLKERFASTQGYVIKGDGSGNTIILAKSAQGAAYGRPVYGGSRNL